MAASAAEIRERLGHPVIDCDAHVIEYLPLVRDFVVEESGEEAARGLDAAIQGTATVGRLPPAARRPLGAMRPPWWALAARSLDRATAMLPRLLRSRLDEVGVDFAFLYPTHGMLALHVTDAETRAASARAFNRYAVEVFADVRDRVEPVAVVPAYTPGEALAALAHAVEELGLKAVVMTGLVPRIAKGAERPIAYDGLGHGAAHDYDPVWQACERLDVTPTFHTPAFSYGTRASGANYMFNHVGGFAAGAEGAARSLLFGGVPVRFPRLRFGFMEGGVAWAVSLRSDIVSHWEKRAGLAIDRYDPSRIDRRLVADLVHEYGTDAIRARADRIEEVLTPLGLPVADHDVIDEFAESALDGPDAIHRVFRDQFFASCEADDPLIFLAFDDRLAAGAHIGVLLGSDLGHWDAPDATQFLTEAWEQVERGLLTPEQLRAVTFDDPLRALAGSGLGPFRGTAVHDEVEAWRAVVDHSSQGVGSKSLARDPVSIQAKR